MLYAMADQGSPPRVRGRADFTGQDLGRNGITPARAGKSWELDCFVTFTQDHPRACGEEK